MRYYVSYWWEDGPAHGHGQLVTDMDGSPRTAEHIADIDNQVCQCLHSRVTVHIVDIIRLDTP